MALDCNGCLTIHEHISNRTVFARTVRFKLCRRKQRMARVNTQISQETDLMRVTNANAPRSLLCTMV